MSTIHAPETSRLRARFQADRAVTGRGMRWYAARTGISKSCLAAFLAEETGLTYEIGRRLERWLDEKTVEDAQ